MIITNSATGPLNKRIRFYQKLFLALLILFVPVVFPVAVGSYKLLHTFLFAFVLAGIWALAYVVTFALLVTYRCPNCGRRFVGWWPFNTHCRQCGFPTE